MDNFLRPIVAVDESGKTHTACEGNDATGFCVYKEKKSNTAVPLQLAVGVPWPITRGKWEFTVLWDGSRITATCHD